MDRDRSEQKDDVDVRKVLAWRKRTAHHTTEIDKTITKYQYNNKRSHGQKMRT